MLIIFICLLMAKEIFKSKDDNNNFNFPIQFCLGSISNGFSATESKEGEKVKREIRVTSYEFKSTSYEFKSTSQDFKYTSYEFKSTS